MAGLCSQGRFLFQLMILTIFYVPSLGSAQADTGPVSLVRTLHGGLQPQAAIDTRGVLHLIFFNGEAGGGNIYYTRQEPGQDVFSKPIRVNSRPKSAVITGTVRGAHMATGKNNRVHVAWVSAHGEGPNNETTMLYTRMNDKGTAFEPQRGVVQFAYGLDGGGSVGADTLGNVYVTWHAGKGDEGSRQVWVARSSDEGRTFSREMNAFPQERGACGCCGMRTLADGRGDIYLLYRTATEAVDRDMYLLISRDQGKSFEGILLQKWRLTTCPMTTASLSEAESSILVAWETDGQVYFADYNKETSTLSPAVSAPGEGKRRKHPAVARNGRGETLLVWMEGAGWNKGGSLAWQVFDSNNRPSTEKGRIDGVPVWGLAAAVTRPEGGFTIFY